MNQMNKHLRYANGIKNKFPELDIPNKMFDYLTETFKNKNINYTNKDELKTNLKKINFNYQKKLNLSEDDFIKEYLKYLENFK